MSGKKHHDQARFYVYGAETRKKRNEKVSWGGLGRTKKPIKVNSEPG